MSQEYLNALGEREGRDFLERLNYSSQQAALYLIGVLIGEIANKQRAPTSDGETGKKVILNKLNYQGMTLSKVKSLLVSLHEKLQQYKVIEFNEETFHHAQRLLEESSENWSLTPAENVYFILTGYSHATFQAIQRGKERRRKSKQNLEGNESESEGE